MKSLIKRLAFTAAFSVSVLATASAQSASTSPEEMLAAINAVKSPVMTREISTDAEKRKEYAEAVAKANAERGELILAFYKAYPDHEQTPDLLYKRWTTLKQITPGATEETVKFILDDIDAITKAGAPAPVVQKGEYTRAYVRQMAAYGDAKKMLAAVEPFVTAYPKDEMGAALLNTVTYQESDSAARMELYKRMMRDYPGSRYTKYVPGKLRQADGLNKAFELKFTDVVSGKEVSMADYKGKVVAIDFWATWCGPCIAELPKMKKLYEELHAKGFEIIGVSLDQPEDKGGLTKLKDFVAKENMPWAQYYQGNYWDSEFSKSWGINAIPCLFLIDQNGNLIDVEAREGLEAKVKALLEKN